MRRQRAVATLLGASALFAANGCSFDRSDRWLYHPTEPGCSVGEIRCQPELERCDDAPEGPAWIRIENCSKQGLVCSELLAACVSCEPGSLGCHDNQTAQCLADGSGWELGETCPEDSGYACRLGTCTQLCDQAARQRSNVGCEYWAADLDNANVGASLNAAAQQFAVVVSNAQPDVSAEVSVYQDDSAPGEPNEEYEVARALIPPRSLRVFQLGPREVDGSAPGTFNTGTHSAITRNAYQVRSTFPVVAYQFNPLSNVSVFSNDASLLKPREAVDPETEEMSDAYVVLGWPQTIATSDDPRFNFNSANPIDLRGFISIIGTRPDTTVRVTPTARIIGAPGIPETWPGEELEVSLGPFDVLNLETDDFNADFTGTLIRADRGVIAFTGSEASDAPYLETLADRRCCADHLEEQLDHVRTAGRVFVAPITPNRSVALRSAGANLGLAEQDDFFRVLATTDAGANVVTSFGKSTAFRLANKGDYIDLIADQSFTLESDQPITLMSVSPSQEAAGVPNNMPGGDPSSLVIPPIEQYRNTYVFLTPDKYAFDFVRIAAPEGAVIVFDGLSLDALDCTTETAGLAARPLADPETWLVHTCQLGRPLIDPTQTPPFDLVPDEQSDGVHVIEANRKIGVLVDGFDRFVSYAYAAGTELEFIVPR